MAMRVIQLAWRSCVVKLLKGIEKYLLLLHP